MVTGVSAATGIALTFEARPFAALSVHEFHDLVRLREEVFVVGQRITAEAEVDGHDPECVHLLGRVAASGGAGGAGTCVGGTLVATARLFLAADPVKVGRVCVVQNLAGRGLGTRLMEYVHEVLAGRPAVMSAQAHLVPWYERLGWLAAGPTYDECGIPHRRLTRAGRSGP